ncbi:amino acid ABC transporter ATP-binding protein [Georgenia subflava]|uniref:ATP-binding cassette domain-containing protein n=1 Tax=Georgenia subflava TaxID=1622177 RepID=A0A6N7ERL1_9MICO|nr:amino acid ABC transporter ATP-binding protein [Georgenia subflava]MPV39175.1 ATP-binding cassette domain-containing protein [Georgenia subflava]
MIDVRGLRKSFGKNLVLDGVDLQVEQGDVVAVIGPSGSGKSTLLRCLNLLEEPDGGTITINDVTVNPPRYTAKEAHALRQQTAMVFQSYNLFRNKTALQNVTEALVVGKKMPRKEADETGRRLLTRVGLSEDTIQQYPITLSGGQQQRVSIARALAVRPKAILLDEPTSALDPELVNEVLAVIRTLAQEHTTMVIVTHEMAFAAEVADRVVFMDGGSVVEAGPPSQVLAAPRHERTRRFLRELGSGSERPRRPEPPEDDGGERALEIPLG